MEDASAKKIGLKTIDDLMALPEGSRAELINGEIVMMAPVSIAHSKIQAKLAQIALSFSDLKEKTKNDDDGWIILTEAWTYYDHHNSFSHDLAAFSLKKLKATPSKSPIKALPEWVCEILSPSNWKKDTQFVRTVLEAHYVPYYWLVDPLNKGLIVFKYEKPFGGYKVVCSVSFEDGEVELPPFDGLKIDLKDLFYLPPGLE